MSKLSLDDLHIILADRAYQISERSKLQAQLETHDRQVKKLTDEIAVKDAEIVRLEAKAQR